MYGGCLDKGYVSMWVCEGSLDVSGRMCHGLFRHLGITYKGHRRPEMSCYRAFS